MSCVIPFLPLATLLILAVTTRKMAESMIAATGVALILLHRNNIVYGHWILFTALYPMGLSSSAFS